MSDELEREEVEELKAVDRDLKRLDRIAIVALVVLAAVGIAVWRLNASVSKLRAGQRITITVQSPSADLTSPQHTHVPLGLAFAYEPTAARFWAVNSGAVRQLFQNGECTQLAANRRFDIVRAIVTAYIANDLARGTAENIPDFDARYWPKLARFARLATGSRPRLHALVVFQPGVDGAGYPAGHIAYVIKVRATSYTISEMHAPRLYKVTTAILPSRPQRGVMFVY